MDVAMPKVSLQGSRIVALVCERVAAGVPEHVRVQLNLASMPARSTMRAKPAALNGPALRGKTLGAGARQHFNMKYLQFKFSTSIHSA
jgi:hypothetical protein